MVDLGVLAMSTGPRPILKWVGGKGQLADELLKFIPKKFNAYYEPFVGGGALFFALYNRGLLADKHIVLSDINQELISTYEAVRDNVNLIITTLSYGGSSFKNDRASFEFVRSARYLYRATAKHVRAARMIYLNKTCYNGLYRVNKKGEFNVPFGKYKNPTICDEVNLRAVSGALQNVGLLCQSFKGVFLTAEKNDFVYFDPPYYPISKTANFTAYARGCFPESEQIALRAIFGELTQRGVKAMLSNSDTPFIRETYEGYNIHQVFSSRRINSKGSGRGKISELIICNY